MYKKLNKGFTIVEIMIVLVIVGILMGLGVPAYLRARTSGQKSACIGNLWQMNEAVKQWTLEKNIVEGISIAGREDEIYEYLRYGEPSCQAGGTYTFGTVGDEPQVTCSKEEALGHKLE